MNPEQVRGLESKENDCAGGKVSIVGQLSKGGRVISSTSVSANDVDRHALPLQFINGLTKSDVSPDRTLQAPKPRLNSIPHCDTIWHPMTLQRHRLACISNILSAYQMAHVDEEGNR
jgi:hypothetical protein